MSCSRQAITEGAAIWWAIVDAIEELQRKREPGEAVN
jgi:hypothetical protein